MKHKITYLLLPLFPKLRTTRFKCTAKYLETLLASSKLLLEYKLNHSSKYQVLVHA